MNKPIHVAITRTVKSGCEDAFEKAILSFFIDAQGSTATLGAQLLRPLPGSGSRTYGILRSFASEQDREAFYESDDFLRCQDAVKPLVEEDYSRRDLHGLEAFFTNPGLITQPPRWKMAFLTWLGVWPTVTFSPAISLIVNCETQEEVDEPWEKLCEGGETEECGWLKDKYGVSWQIVPTVLGEMLQDKDPKKSEKVMEALIQMKEIEIKTLKQAYEKK